MKPKEHVCYEFTLTGWTESGLNCVRIDNDKTIQRKGFSEIGFPRSAYSIPGEFDMSGNPLVLVMWFNGDTDVEEVFAIVHFTTKEDFTIAKRKKTLTQLQNK